MCIFFNVILSQRPVVSEVVWIWDSSGLSIRSRSAKGDRTRYYVNSILQIASSIYSGPLCGPNYSRMQ